MKKHGGHRIGLPLWHRWSDCPYTCSTPNKECKLYQEERKSENVNLGDCYVEDPSKVLERRRRRLRGLLSSAAQNEMPNTGSEETDVTKNLKTMCMCAIWWYDSVKLLQILNNILSNAVKYTDKGKLYAVLVLKQQIYVFDYLVSYHIKLSLLPK